MVNYHNNEEQGIRLDEIFAALSYDKRRGMVLDLALRPSTVKQLAVQYNLSLPAMHKHIRLLEQAGLITRRKIGRTNFIGFKTEGMQALQQWAMQFNLAWANDNASLENYLPGLQK